MKILVSDCGDAAVRVTFRAGSRDQSWRSAHQLSSWLDAQGRQQHLRGTIATYDAVLVEFDATRTWFGIPFFRIGARPHRFGGRWDIPLTDGPDITEFGRTVDRLYQHDYTVGASSNHIGLRLARADHGPIPHRQARTEVLSRGVPIGAVEVPAGDEILVLHRGRGVTAGYPVLAVVTTVGLSRLGQARPGDTVRFRPVSTATAIADLRRQQAHLEDVGSRVRTAFSSLGIPLPCEAPEPRGHPVP